MKRFSLKATVALLAALVAAASVSMAVRVQAQGGPDQGAPNNPDQPAAFISWHGMVDNKMDISIQGSRVWTTLIAGNDTGTQGFRVNQPLPSDHVFVNLARVEGRGTVRIIQQPRGDNGYTAVIRIHDPQAGSGFYRVALSW